MKSLFLTISLLLCSGFLGGCLSGPAGNDKKEDYTPANITAINNVLPDFPDTTKAKDGSESNMCWAMASCNALVYQGYMLDTQVCVNRMFEYRGNQYGNSHLSFKWYLTTYLSISQPNRYLEAMYDKVGLPEWTMDMIDLGQPVMLKLKPVEGDVGHVVSVYGYEYNDVTDTVVLLVTDGDDGPLYERRIILQWTGANWFLSGMGYKNYTLRNASAVKEAP